MLKNLAIAALLSVPFVGAANADDLVTSIDTEAAILTMVNVLTPNDGDQDALVAQLQRALEVDLLDEPGFISGNVHRSLDSEHVVNYAQWQDQASLEAFVAKLQAGGAPDMAQVCTIATPDFHPFAVVSVHAPTN